MQVRRQTYTLTKDAWSSLDKEESLACQITSQFNEKIGCFAVSAWGRYTYMLDLQLSKLPIHTNGQILPIGRKTQTYSRRTKIAFSASEKKFYPSKACA